MKGKDSEAFSPGSLCNCQTIWVVRHQSVLGVFAMKHIFRLLAILTLVTNFRGLALAGSLEDYEACTKATDSTAIDLCTVFLNRENEGAKDRVEAYSKRCSAHIRRGEFDAAIADCNEAIKLGPEYIQPLVNLGVAYLSKRDFDRAILESSKAIKLNPGELSAWNNRGVAHFRKGEYDLAIADFDEGIRLNDQYPNPFRHRAAAKLAKGDLIGARADVESSLALKPDYAEAKQTLASIEAAEQKAKGTDVASKTEQDEENLPPTSPQKPMALGKRVALVIGNGAYLDGMALPNPVNDAKAMAASLGRLGFDVIVSTDATKADMTDAMYRFAVSAEGADAALVFYAGHGMQVDGVNYLMPVDATLATQADLKHKFVAADEILNDLKTVKGMRMLVLDACRNNPLSRSIKLKLAKMTSRAIDNRNGLADMKAEGVLIAFATQPNEVAADGAESNSPFTLAMLKHLETKNIEIDTMFKRVRTTVSEMTDGVQLPQTVNSSTGEFYLKPN
jgi:tetratricopeptide (TPR) repeat protein